MSGLSVNEMHKLKREIIASQKKANLYLRQLQWYVRAAKNKDALIKECTKVESSGEEEN